MKLLRNYIIVLAVVAAVAVTLAVLSVGGYLTKADVAVVSPKDPLAADLTESGDESLADLFSKAIKQATLLDEPPELPENAPSVILQTRTAGGRFVGAYSLTVLRMIDRYAVVEDLSEGTFYRLSVTGFETLLSHEAFQDLPMQRYEAPLLSLKGELWEDAFALSPNTAALHVFTASGTAKEQNVLAETSVKRLELTTEQAAQLPEISGENLPDSWSLTLKKGETQVLTQDRVKTSELAFPQEAGDYLCTLTAHWNLSAEQDWYGDVTYEFTVRIEEPQPPQDLPQDTEENTAP